MNFQSIPAGIESNLHAAEIPYNSALSRIIDFSFFLKASKAEFWQMIVTRRG
jgi:hypothetical protein